ncbi:endolytic transglycosylase MltG [Crassaminicella thermophila]|uniref:Endolytic murein transglycosylase n=1 Tax=Crassaminicella thermophila TaxID=2599308 RepID=A0A5C0SFK4_CRATE|nr:endolytic transglycosylase MltG [Crassaminicella thermophila]QEK12114.1 endolytic transglycosylase MltG [Crassaminicella thermophila]
MKSSLKNRMIIFIFSIVILLGGFKLYFDKQVGPVNANSDNEVTIEIPIGASTNKIAKILKEKNVVNNELAFRILSKLSKTDGKMQAGIYLLKVNMSANEIINTLVKGETIKDTVKFTIPEGFEFNQIVDRLETKGLINRDEFVRIANYGDFEYKFLRDVPKGQNRLEGYLFPDTYEVSKNASEREIIIKMLNRFDDIFVDTYYNRAKELNMSVNEIVTLASIIEKEAKLNKERALVSSVFYNRMKKGMYLQSCATVQYVLDKRKTKLSLKDLEVNSPYNTYKYYGLPPKPIASPGKASIEAALYPKDSDYLYFVVGKNGEHHFSKTYKEHLNAKNGN